MTPPEVGTWAGGSRGVWTLAPSLEGHQADVCAEKTWWVLHGPQHTLLPGHEAQGPSRGTKVYIVNKGK